MLKIYESPYPDKEFSSGAEYTDPLSMILDGSSGGILERRFYIRNDDTRYYYESIALQPIDGGDSIIDGTDGYYWKLIVGDKRPLEEEWALVSAANSISFSDIGSSAGTDTYTYLPFWLRVAIPRNAPVNGYKATVLRITANESEVS